MPPPKNQDFEKGDWHEYRRLHIETLEWLKDEVRKLHDDVLLLKFKMFMVTVVVSSVASIISTLVIQFITLTLKH